MSKRIMASSLPKYAADNALQVRLLCVGALPFRRTSAYHYKVRCSRVSEDFKFQSLQDFNIMQFSSDASLPTATLRTVLKAGAACMA